VRRHFDLEQRAALRLTQIPRGSGLVGFIQRI